MSQPVHPSVSSQPLVIRKLSHIHSTTYDPFHHVYQLEVSWIGSRKHEYICIPEDILCKALTKSQRSAEESVELSLSQIQRQNQQGLVNKNKPLEWNKTLRQLGISIFKKEEDQ